MGHRISAVIVAGEVDRDCARQFDAKLVPCLKVFSLIALDPQYIDTWSAKLGLHDETDCVPLLDCHVVRHIAQQIAPDALYAIIETDYWAGAGEQSAVVYRGENQIMSPQTARLGPINAALRLIGVPRRAGDEFQSLGLSLYRD